MSEQTYTLENNRNGSKIRKVLFVLYLFVLRVISGFGFEGWICVIIVSVPDLCILFQLYALSKTPIFKSA